jgi:FAD/FMN-containing dehydrogenase
LRSVSYLKAASATTLNVALNAATLGRYVWLEGRVRGGVFRNWARRFRYAPERFVEPATEQEIAEVVRSSENLRVFGSGHSFNAGVVSDGTLLSLDKYSGPVAGGDAKERDYRSKDQLAVKGGTRVRDVVRLLLEERLAFEALPSHDAQSIAGNLSTDVHGTGVKWGFVSDSVVGLKLIDGKGDLHECQPSDDLFKAAIGGVGAVGLIIEVVVQGVRRFNVAQRVSIEDLSFVERNLDRLLREHDHLSLYLFPFSDKCQVNTWDGTYEGHSPLGGLREFMSISLDALLAAWVGNLLAYTGLLPKVGSRAYLKKRGTDLVLESDAAFNRTIYHLHQELEFTVPFEQTFEACGRFIELYERMYDSGLPYTLVEVRFTPAGHDRTLIGPGRGRHSTWIDLVCTDSHGFEDYYAAAQELIKEIGGRPHLGKFCESFGKADLARVHQGSFTRFLKLVEAHDPHGRFANGFTRRLLGHPSPG